MCPIGFFKEVDTVNETARCTMCDRACTHCVGAGPDACADPDLARNYWGYYVTGPD